jgi:hypothetical protein
MQSVRRLTKFNPAILVAAATVLAAFLRFFHLASLAPEAWFDEVWFALRARELLQHPDFIVFYKTPWGGGNALLVYLTALVQWLGFTGISSSRFASAALGVLAVPLAYACFKEMLNPLSVRATKWRGISLSTNQNKSTNNIDRDRDSSSQTSLLGMTGYQTRWVAAVAALILSYLLYGIIVARVGTEPSLAPAAALFCVWQLKVGKRKLTTEGTKSILQFSNYFLLGLSAALAQYNGPHARFILPVVGFVALHDLLLMPAPVRPNLIRGYSIAIASALLIASPLLYFFYQNPEWLLARARITSGGPLSNPEEFRRNLWFLSISFNFMGSFDPLTNYPGLPMFDLVQSLGWFVGHGWAVWHWRRSTLVRELLVWEAIMILPSLLTSDAPNFQRMIGVAAPAACLIALGWWLIVRWFLTTLFVPRLAGAIRLLGLGLLGLGIFLSPFYQAYTFLVRYPQLSILPVSYLNAPVRVGRELVARANAGERVFVSRHPEDVEAQDDIIAFEFLFPNTPVERLDFRQCLPLTSDRPTRTNYLVLTDRDKTSAPILYDTYPDSKITSAYYWQDFGTWFEVPPHDSGPNPPLAAHARFDPGLTLLGYEWSSESVPAGQSLFLTLWWRADIDLNSDYTSFVHVGANSVVAQHDGQPCQGLFPTSHWRAGDLVRDSFAITIPAEVAAGNYPLAVGWYTFPDFVRQPLLEADQALPDDRAIFASVTITP